MCGLERLGNLDGVLQRLIERQGSVSGVPSNTAVAGRSSESRQMWGWFKAATERAWRCKGSLNPAADTLMATVRSRRVSRTFHTSPMAPTPSGASISYGPKRVPAETAIAAIESSISDQ